jgi:type II secretory pathway pseudopilin PulG
MAHPASDLRTKGFTLLETVVAAAITVVLLSAVSGINHTVQSSVAREEDAAQMGALADESISQVQFWRDAMTTYNSTQLTDSSNSGVSLSQNSGDTDAHVEGTFYAPPQTSGNCINNGSVAVPCDFVENGGPVVFMWCDASTNKNSKCADGNTRLRSIVTPFIPPSSSAGSYTLNKAFGFSSTVLGMADPVAIPLKPYATVSQCMNGTRNDCRFMVDSSNGIQNEVSSLQAGVTPGWSFYSRTVSISRPGIVPACDASVKAAYRSDQTNFVTAPQCALLRSNAIYVTVTVTNTANPQSTLTKTVMLANSLL